MASLVDEQLGGPMTADHRRNRIRTGVVALCLLALLMAITLLPSADTQAAVLTATVPSKALLERQKLQQEVRKLKHENDTAGGASGFFSRDAAFITALVALGGLLATFWKQISDQSAQRQRDLEQREVEGVRRLEDRFAAILNDLGSAAIPIQAGAASSLVTYLRPEHKRFHHQVRVAVLTNLKVDHDEAIRKLLARVYREALDTGEKADGFERDLSRADLANTDLSGLELRHADLGFADMRNSSLVGCDFFRARGIEVKLEGARVCTVGDRVTSLIEVRFHKAKCMGADFSGTRMVNAHLEGADLRQARFFQARVQAAHFEGALLQGAQFQSANLNDAYFYGAQFDDVALRSIIQAFNWRKAYFDPSIWELLYKLEKRSPTTPIRTQ